MISFKEFLIEQGSIGLSTSKGPVDRIKVIKYENGRYGLLSLDMSGKGSIELVKKYGFKWSNTIPYPFKTYKTRKEFDKDLKGIFGIDPKIVTDNKMISESDLEVIVSEILQDKIATLVFLSENEFLNESLETLNEAQVVESVNDWLKKVGLKLHKGDGIVDYIKQFSTGAGKIIIAAIKGDKEKVKEIANSLEKEKVVDFLLKLDMASLHLITGPIHFIDAITGWDLMVNIKHSAEGAKDVLKKFYSAIKAVKDSIVKVLDGNKKEKMLKVVDNLEYNMPNVNEGYRREFRDISERVRVDAKMAISDLRKMHLYPETIMDSRKVWDLNSFKKVLDKWVKEMAGQEEVSDKELGYWREIQMDAENAYKILTTENN